MQLVRGTGGATTATLHSTFRRVAGGNGSLVSATQPGRAVGDITVAAGLQGAMLLTGGLSTGTPNLRRGCQGPRWPSGS
eukprot:10139296-Alexandrium_andersonii.AAC.1